MIQRVSKPNPLYFYTREATRVSDNGHIQFCFPISAKVADVPSKRQLREWEVEREKKKIMLRITCAVYKIFTFPKDNAE